MPRLEGPAGRRVPWLLAAAVVAALIWAWLRGEHTQLQTETIPLAEFLAKLPDRAAETSEDDSPLDLPADHGAHPRARTEAWGLTAALTGPDGRRFHCQFALFRLALRPDAPPRASAWAARQIYRAHLALTDAAGGRQLAYERLSRDALGLAGADDGGQPRRLWLEDWSLEIPDGGSALHLSAAQDGVRVDLRVTGEGPLVTPLVTQADLEPTAGAGARPRGYLIPRLTAAGTLALQGQEIAVKGNAWLEHAWGALPLGGGQLALARFALRLADGRDLLCLRTSRRDGGGTPIPTCTLIGPDGGRRGFERQDLALEPQREWPSPRDGTRYPVAWRLTLPGAGLELNLTPLIEAQELDLSLRLWAGGVTLSGTAGGTPIAGVGYLDLVGYGPEGTGK